jgi:type I restriction enzyme S subunit
MRLKFNEAIISSNRFMNYSFNSKQIISSLRNIATGTTSVAAIYTRDLLNIMLHIPSLQEQTKIASILSDMDAEIALLEQKLSKYKLLKQGLMQNLLTGKIRLV